MAKYKLIALSVQISGKVFLKEDKDIFDTDGKESSIKNEIESAAAAGFLVELNAKEYKAFIEAEKEAQKKAEIEAKLKADADAKLAKEIEEAAAALQLEKDLQLLAEAEEVKKRLEIK